ncbi:MAG: hypothetical protein Q8K55_02095 [Gemmatimonadaceae bacterium]|nr:hypothetical protein [Gemmatimonadaceae bacterium]
MKKTGLVLALLGSINGGGITIGIFSGIFTLSVWAISDLIFGVIFIVVGIAMMKVKNPFGRDLFEENLLREFGQTHQYLKAKPPRLSKLR